jgi:TetR/AcrR family transcriptional regulator
MPIKTDEHIKEVAKRMFFKEGRFDARLHEIADAAKVNKALLHYYFRDREKLLQVVYEEALDASFLKMFELLSEKKAFEKKIARAIGHMTDFLCEYPFIEPFIVSQANASAQGAILPVKAAREFTGNFRPEVQAYLEKRRIRDTSPEEFIVNMMALCAYPASTKPVIKSIFNLSEKDFQEFITQRKKQVTRMVLMKF